MNLKSKPTTIEGGKLREEGRNARCYNVCVAFILQDTSFGFIIITKGETALVW